MTTSKPAYYESYWAQNDAWNPDAGANNPEEKQLFDRLLKPGMTLIDYGCGNGERYGPEMLARKIDYRGFDISEAALENAARLGLKVGRIGQDSTLPFPSDAADAAICLEVLEHLMEPDRAMAEIYRALKPGGIAILSVPNCAFISQRIEFLLTGFWNPGGSPLTARRTPWRDAHIRFYNPALLRRMLDSCGFEFSFLLAEPFSLAGLPWCYRQARLHPLLNALSKPFAWLGRALPGLFSLRLFAVVRKSSAVTL